LGLAEVANLAVRINLEGNASRELTGLQKQVGSLSKGFGRAGKGVGQIGTGIARAGASIAVGLGAIGVGAAKLAIDYEDAFAGVRKTVDASEEQLATLSGRFREMATEIPIAATEFARLGEIAGALGVEVDAIDEFVEVTAKLGVTTDLTADAAADALGRIGNIVGLTADEYDNLGSALVNLGNKGASTEPEIIEITKRFAAAGKQAGLATPEMLGFAEAIASFTGLEPEAAGMAFSNMLNQLTKVTANGGKKLDILNKVVGEDFKKAFDKDASGALLKFLGGLKKLDKYERAKVLRALGLDAGRLRQLLNGLSDNVDDVGVSLNNADEGWRGNFLNQEAAEKFKTLASKLTLLKQNFFEAGLTLADGFMPALTRSTDKLIAFLKVPGNKAELKSIGEDIGKAIDGIEWDKVLDGAKSLVKVMKSALSWAKKLFDIFNALPTELKGLLVGAAALNKLSGGLIAQGAGNVVGGLAQGAASRLPGVGKLFAQPVFVTNFPPGFGMGGGPLGGGKGGGKLGLGLKGAGGLLLGLTGVGLAASLASEFEDEIQGLSEDLSRGWRDAAKSTFGVSIPTFSPKDLEWPFGPKNTPTILPEVFGGNGLLGGAPGAPNEKWYKPPPGKGPPSVRVPPGIKPSDIKPVVVNLQRLNTTSDAQKAELSNIKNAVIKPPPPPKGVASGALPNRAQTDELRNIKSAVTTAAQHNRVQADELRNIKSASATQSAAQKAEIANAKNAIVTMSSQQKATLLAQTAVNVAGNLAAGFHSVSNVIATAATTRAAQTAGTTAASASRSAGYTVSGAMSGAASRIVGAIWAARPVIQPTTVINKYNTTQRGGVSSDSRYNGGYGSG
jgi:TP901 family phage tail tape measure protein